MGVRFSKRIKVLPWVTANVGKSGVSLTIGPKGKTLNIGSTGVNVNVSLGKGMGYSKRLVTWRKLNLLGWLGIGGSAAGAVTKGRGGATKGRGGSQADASAKSASANKRISLDEAIAEAERQQDVTQPDGTVVEGVTTPDPQTTAGGQQEQAGCGPVGCALGVVAIVVIIALVAAVAYLLIRLNAQPVTAA